MHKDTIELQTIWFRENKTSGNKETFSVTDCHMKIKKPLKGL